MVHAALDEACRLTLPDMDELSQRMLGNDEDGFRSVRYFRDRDPMLWIWHEPWMTTIVDLVTGQVRVVDGRDHKGVGNWVFACPLQWRLGVQVDAINPSAAFRKAFGMWLTRTSIAVGHFHLVSLASQAVTVPFRISLAGKGSPRHRRGLGAPDAALRAGDKLFDASVHRLVEVFIASDATGKVKAVWHVKEQWRALLRTKAVTDSAGTKVGLMTLGECAGRPETNRLYRAVCWWWNEMKVRIVTGAHEKPLTLGYTGSEPSPAGRSERSKRRGGWAYQGPRALDRRTGDGAAVRLRRRAPDRRAEDHPVRGVVVPRFRILIPPKVRTTPGAFAVLDRCFRLLCGAPTYVLTDNEKTVINAPPPGFWSGTSRLWTPPDTMVSPC